ncbi:oligopeptide transport system ATP-binding protein [Caminicella sporogenes DSM 14501]|uniref:Oligopeptide transport system ATP-binding protein n=1 Tax=Caminicella sporogenes DSM 14501 TaxID=1121266 RepID=A0A1M6SZN8_9FIRM|nr:dipeptide ABC transporter ATP-binding protein [Caminicella sporogenes]RKD26388.1 peptide ABC transporter ATP-binding protein [Caminicella sporogenes]SHK50174.1 oligopeptide transport system ATP-binding protein [Caminicella sporogenes DSM 14501]
MTNDIKLNKDNNEILLEVKNLKKYFPINKGFIKKKIQYVKAVDDISFFIRKGETFGLVGESGCGKSTTGRTIIRLYDVTDGEVIFDGAEIGKLRESQLKPFRKRIQMIFQDPYASLNSRMTVGDIIGEPLDIHNLAKGKERQEIIYDLLERVGLSKDHANRYPHEFSGGQRQRIGIARALAVRPDFIICDEPISALDVSIQAQVVNMLEDLQSEMGLTYLFIAHDLSMVKHISDRIGVMYLGKLVEVAPSNELYSNPLHPYTQALLSAIPIPDPEVTRSKRRIVLQGDVPSPLNPPSGCRFRTRCRYATEKCAQVEPKLVDIGNGHMHACHYADDIKRGTKEISNKKALDVK